MQPHLDGEERKLDQVKVEQICRKVQQAHTVFLNHFTYVSNLMNQGFVDNEHKVGEGPFIYVQE